MSSIVASVVWPRFSSSVMQMLTMFVALCLTLSAVMILVAGPACLGADAIS